MKRFNLWSFAIVLGFGLSSMVATGQSPEFCSRGRLILEDYTLKDARADFQYAQQLSETDSMALKASLLYRVVLFDSTSRMAQLAQQALSGMKARYLEEIAASIEGEWDWGWSGSTGPSADGGRGQDPKNCQCTKKIIVSKDSIAYYRDGQLEKTVAYQFAVHDRDVGRQVFQLYTEGSCWYVYVGDQSNNIQARKPTDGRQFLNINLMAGCVCGCPYESYERKK